MFLIKNFKLFKAFKNLIFKEGFHLFDFIYLSLFNFHQNYL